METFSLVFNLIVWLLILVFTIYSIHSVLISEKGKYPPFVPSTGKAKKIILSEVSKILQNSSKPLTVLDPGCGIGSLLVPLAKKFPQHKFVGIDWSWPYYVAKFRASKNLKFINDDLFKQSFEEADVVVCFLVEKLKMPFVEKLIKEAKKKVVIFSIYVEMPLLNLEEKFNYKHFGVVDSNIYVYHIEPGKLK